MSDESVSQTPAVFSSKERAALVARALSEAARRARFSTKRRRSLTSGGLRARRGARLFELVRLLSFVGVVAIPCVSFGVYIFFFASSQYVAELRFTVSSGIPIGVGNLAGISGEMIAQDTQIILNYMESRAIVETLQKTIGLTSFFQNPDVDYFSRLPAKELIEKTVKYWKRHLETKVTLPAGIVTFSVRAFSPEDSVVITTAVLDASENLINRMNDQMRKDAVAVADTERKRAQAHLADTMANLEQARNQEGILSADATSQGYDKLLSEVKSDKIKLEETYDLQRKFVSADAPQLKNLQSKIDATQDQIAKIESQLTTASGDAGEAPPGPTGARVLSGSMSRLDYAKLENEIAEKIYAASLASLEEAHLAAEMKFMYVNRFIEPVAPQRSTYPKRGLWFAILSLSCLTLWGTILFSAKFALNKLL